MDDRQSLVGILTILALAVVLRSYHFTAAIADSLQVKQNFTANKGAVLQRSRLTPY